MIEKEKDRVSKYRDKKNVCKKERRVGNGGTVFIVLHNKTYFQQ